jgi:glycosyltransferase involved in cell wall biosynthesis
MPKPRLLYLHNIDITVQKANLVQVVSMCNAWHEAGYSTTLVLRSSGLNEANGIALLRSQFGLTEGIELRLIRLRFPPRISRYLSPLAIRGIIKAESPDFCFVRDPLFYRQALKTGIPAIMELHNNKMHHGRAFIDRWMGRMVISGSGHPCTITLIAISEALKKWWVDAGIPANKIVSLHDGFSRKMFSGSYSREVVRQELGLPTGRRIVLYTGNLQANRGIDYILSLAAQNPDLLFVLVGGVEKLREYYEQYCREHKIGNTLFTGQVPHPSVPLYLYSADVLLAMWSREVPTINYCSPLKVFEYMATGIPAVYPGYPTIREVVEDGVTGFLSKPDDIFSLHNALQRALNLSASEADSFAESSKQVALSRYAWDARIRKIKELLPSHLRTT